MTTTTSKLAIEQRFINDARFPIVLSSVGTSRDVSVDDLIAWFVDSSELVTELLHRHGAILLRGFRSLKGADDFERIAQVLAPTMMDYVGGTSPRRVVRNKILASTEMPPGFSIPLHQEMSYTNNAPDRVAFFCEVPPDELGRTPIADMRRVTRLIPSRLIDTFERRGLRLRRSLPGPQGLAKKAGVAKSWGEVFGTTEKSEVEQIAASRSWEAQWLANDWLQLTQELRAAMREHPKTHDVVWFNQAHIFGTYASSSWAWRDRRYKAWARVRWQSIVSPELVDQVVHGDGVPVAAQDVAVINDAFDRETVSFDWQASDVLLLDNILAAHGRTRYAGRRRILAALLRDTPSATASAVTSQTRSS